MATPFIYIDDNFQSFNFQKFTLKQTVYQEVIDVLTN